MKIGFFVSPTCAVSGMGSGVLKQASVWAEGLRLHGHEVDFVGPAKDGSIQALKAFDIVHFIHYGHWLKAFLDKDLDSSRWFFSPVIDSTASLRRYGLLARLPLQHYLMSFGPRVLRDFSMRTTVSVRSEYEKAIIAAVAPDARVDQVPIALSIEDGEHCRPKVELPSEFALFVGGMFAARKNVVRLIQACELLNLPLVLVGNERSTACMRRVAAEAEKANVPVLRLGFLDESELRWLYANCSVFCLPSLIEGVGQVAMEALYFGAPTIVTSVGGPPDYFGDLVDYVDPSSVKGIAEGMKLAMQRTVDVECARAHLSQYSPEAVGLRLSDSYHKAGL